MALAALSGHAATMLWDEEIDGTLDPYAEWPTNKFVRAVGVASDEVNMVRGVVTLAPYFPPWGTIYGATSDAFSFIVPQDRQLVGILLTQIGDYDLSAWGGIYASATGPWDGAGQLPGTEYGWHATDVNGTNDIFVMLGISILPGGVYALNVYPHGRPPDAATLRYTMYILTAPAPPTLQIAHAGSDVKLSWPTNNASGFSLQSTTNLTAPFSWVAVTNEPALVADQFELTTPMLPGQQFFRLLKQ